MTMGSERFRNDVRLRGNKYAAGLVVSIIQMMKGLPKLVGRVNLARTKKCIEFIEAKQGTNCSN